MTLSKTKKIVFLSVILVLLATLIFLLIPKKTLIAFYGLNGKEINAIQSTILNLNSKQIKTKKFRFKVFDDKKDLLSQVKESKPSLVFSVAGSQVKNLCESKKSRFVLDSVLSDNFDKLTSSMRGMILTKTKKDTIFVDAIPVLSSHYEVAINMNYYRQLGIKSISTWNDIEKFAERSKKNFNAGIFVDFGTPSSALDFFGAVTESLSSKTAYDQIVSTVNSYAKDGNFNSENIVQELLQNGTISKTVKMLKSWDEKNLFADGTFNATFTSIENFLKSDLVSVSFMTLNTHRTIERKTIEQFTSIYVPSMILASNRSFTSPTIFALPQKNSKQINLLLKELLNSENQGYLSVRTGLAPVLSQCKTADKQADDARFWVASTQSPVAGLSRDLFLTEDEKSDLAKSLIAQIRF